MQTPKQSPSDRTSPAPLGCSRLAAAMAWLPALVWLAAAPWPKARIATSRQPRGRSRHLDDAKKEGVRSTGNVMLTQGTMYDQGRPHGREAGRGRFQARHRLRQARATSARSAKASTNTSKALPSASNTTARPTRCRCSPTRASSDGSDEVRGNYISYDAVTEFFQVIGGGKSGGHAGNPQGRVRAVIQPKARRPGRRRRAPPSPRSDLQTRRGSLQAAEAMTAALEPPPCLRYITSS